MMQDRHPGDDDQGVLEQIGELLALHCWPSSMDAAGLGVENEDVAQHQLQRVEVRALQIDQRVEVGVPLAIAYMSAITAIIGLASGSTIDQRKRRSLQPSSSAASASSSGIADPEVRAGDDHLPDADGLRDDQCPRVSSMPEVLTTM